MKSMADGASFQRNFVNSRSRGNISFCSNHAFITFKYTFKYEESKKIIRFFLAFGFFCYLKISKKFSKFKLSVFCLPTVDYFFSPL
jgi:hypothetical protein